MQVNPATASLYIASPLAGQGSFGFNLVHSVVVDGNVVITFPAVQEGTSVRLRIEETYTDPARYGIVDGQLMWNRSFGRPRNDIVLPAAESACYLPWDISMRGTSRWWMRLGGAATPLS